MSGQGAAFFDLDKTLMAVDLVQHLRVDPRQDSGEHRGGHALDVPLGDLGEDALRDLQHRIGLLVR